MSYKNGDRVVLQSDINSSVKIEAGTVCTICQLLDMRNKQTLVLRSGYDNETGTPIVFGVSPEMVRNATLEEIKAVSYKSLVSDNVFIGTVYTVGKEVSFNGMGYGTKGTIKDIELKENEFKDLITFTFETDDTFDGLLEKKFERHFVDMYFYIYNEQFEKMLGEELDLKNGKKNFFVVGAKVISKEGPAVIREVKGEICTVQSLDKEYKYEFPARKDSLTPITDLEAYYSQNSPLTLMPAMYQADKQLIAKDSIADHVFLSKNFKPKQVIKILGFESINLNIHEDKYIIEQEGRKFVMPWMDLDMYFIPYFKSEEDNETKDPEFWEVLKEEKVKIDNVVEDFSDAGKSHTLNPLLFEEDNEVNQVETQPNEQVEIIVHNLSILGYNFEVNRENRSLFKLDGSNREYNIEEVELLVKALNSFKTFMAK